MTLEERLQAGWAIVLWATTVVTAGVIIGLMFR